MNRYAGPATLVLSNGTEYATTATLRIDIQPTRLGRGRWAGRLELTEEARWFAFNDSTPVLRMPDGRESQVLVAVDGTVKGAGDAPFGDA